MYRLSSLLRLPLVATALPEHFTSTADLAFYFPRFQPSTHVQHAGIPEVQEALGLLPSYTCRVARPAEDPLHKLASKTETGKRDVEEASLVTRWGWDGRAAKCLRLLDRGVEILESAGGIASPPIRRLLLPLYATRFELLFGTAHLPRPTYVAPGLASSWVSTGEAYRGGSLHVPKHILYHASRVLLSGGFALEDGGGVTPTEIDTDCVILAHFVKAFCLLNTRPFNKSTAAANTALSSSTGPSYLKKKRGTDSSPYSPSSSWKLSTPEGYMTLGVALERLDQLVARVEAAICMSVEKGDSIAFPPSSWRLYIPKLLLMKAILTIAQTGHLLQAKGLVDRAAEMTNKLKQPKHILLEGVSEGARKAEPELGLFMLAQAEIMARVWDWDGGKKGSLPQSITSTSYSSSSVIGQLDEDVFDAFEMAASFYAQPFSDTLHPDGIMDVNLVPLRSFEVHAYIVCIISLAGILMNAPREAVGGISKATFDPSSALSSVHQDTKPVFLSQQLFALQPPLLTVQSPSSIIFTDSARLRPLSLEASRKMIGRLLERALQLTRALYPDQQHHPLALHTLSLMACLYADTRDYLYASGLFESAKKGISLQYGGQLSVESVFIEKLRYEFLAGVGSADEAKTASHEIIQHLKQMDGLPVT